MARRQIRLAGIFIQDVRDSEDACGLFPASGAHPPQFGGAVALLPEVTSDHPMAMMPEQQKENDDDEHEPDQAMAAVVVIAAAIAVIPAAAEKQHQDDNDQDQRHFLESFPRSVPGGRL